MTFDDKPLIISMLLAFMALAFERNERAISPLPATERSRSSCEAIAPSRCRVLHAIVSKSGRASLVRFDPHIAMSSVKVGSGGEQ